MPSIEPIGSKVMRLGPMSIASSGLKTRRKKEMSSLSPLSFAQKTLFPVFFRKIFPKILPSVSFPVARRYSLANMTSQPDWSVEKTKILNLPLAEKRKLYKAKDYVTLDSVDPWTTYVVKNKGVEAKKHTLDDLEEFKKITLGPDNILDKSLELNHKLAERVSIYKGDITKLEVDVIVNAANSLLRAGGGVDGAIHRAAGPLLQQECNTLGGCPTGQAKITGGYNLPAKYVIHTVGPQDGSVPALESCYRQCLEYQKEHHFKSIAFPCISTGIYGFPNRLAAHIALRTVRKFLETDEDMERVVFCTFMPIDIDIYETLMQMYFPLHQWNYQDGASVTE